MYSFAGELPRHLYCRVDSAFTHKERRGFIPAMWFGLTSYPGRMWGCTVLLECGAVYRNVPPHAIAFTEDPEQEWAADQAQRWDCYGWKFTTIEYTALRGLDCRTLGGHTGSYLFTAAPIGDAYSAEPEQAKEFMFVKLYNGRLTIQPTDKLIFRDNSFTGNFKWPEGLKRQADVYTCED